MTDHVTPVPSENPEDPDSLYDTTAALDFRFTSEELDFLEDDPLFTAHVPEEPAAPLINQKLVRAAAASFIDLFNRKAAAEVRDRYRITVHPRAVHITREGQVTETTYRVDVSFTHAPTVWADIVDDVLAAGGSLLPGDWSHPEIARDVLSCEEELAHRIYMIASPGTAQHHEVLDLLYPWVDTERFARRKLIRGTASALVAAQLTDEPWSNAPTAVKDEVKRSVRGDLISDATPELVLALVREARVREQEIATGRRDRTPRGRASTTPDWVASRILAATQELTEHRMTGTATVARVSPFHTIQESWIMQEEAARKNKKREWVIATNAVVDAALAQQTAGLEVCPLPVPPASSSPICY